MTDTIVAPTRAEQRIDTLDVLRGVAICGILLMNIPTMGTVSETGMPSLPAAWNANWIAYAVQHLFFEGTMRGLFSMLFGAGMLLMLRRTFGERPELAPVDVWTRRCLALMALGVVQWAVFFWPGEILWNYGLTGFILLSFRTARVRTLLIAAAMALAVCVVSFGWQDIDHARKVAASAPAIAARTAGKPLTDEQKAQVKSYDEMRDALHPTAKATAEAVAKRLYLPTLFAWSWDIWSHWNLRLDGWLGVAESLGFMLIGMALFRLGILTGDASAGTYARLMAVCYPLGFAIRGYGLWMGSRIGFDVDIANISLFRAAWHGSMYEPARLLITLGHIGLIVTLYRRGVLGAAWPLRALGRTALSVYFFESLVTSVLFYVLGYLNAFGFAALMGISVLIWIAAGALATAWLARHEMGPMEALLRSVAYATFRRRKRQAAEVLAVTPAI